MLGRFVVCLHKVLSLPQVHLTSQAHHSGFVSRLRKKAQIVAIRYDVTHLMALTIHVLSNKDHSSVHMVTKFTEQFAQERIICHLYMQVVNDKHRSLVGIKYPMLL